MVLVEKWPNQIFWQIDLNGDFVKKTCAEVTTTFASDLSSFTKDANAATPLSDSSVFFVFLEQKNK